MSLSPPPRAAVLAAAALGFVPCLAPRAHASGFSIYEQGGRAIGFAGAYTAVTDDPSAIFHNAAGIAFLKGTQIYLGGTLVAPHSTFVGDNPYPGAGVTEIQDPGIVPVPTFYFTQKLGKSVVWGLGLDAPFGLKTQWENPNTFTGRYISLKAELKGFAINPTVAFKLADRLALGVGVDVRLAKVQLVRRIPGVLPTTQQIVDIAEADLEGGTDTGVGFNVGLVAKPTDELSLGLAYRHHVTVDFAGTATFTLIPTGVPPFDAAVAANPLLQGTPALTTSIDFPSILAGGVAYKWDKWTVAGDLVWFDWSRFAKLVIHFPDRPQLDQTIIEDYEDSWQIRVGLERRLSDRWAVRGGYQYDKTPVPPASVSPILPDQSRNGLALGGSWTSGRLRLDAGLWYLFLSPRSTMGVSRDNYNGSYDNSAFTFGLSLGYQF
jgi:long-chain fatty acid transport protein